MTRPTSRNRRSGQTRPPGGMSGLLASGYRSTFGQAAVGAFLLWAALPPLDLWPLAWVAPAWWVLLIRREELPGRRPYAALWLVGFLFWLAAIHWLRLPHWATSFGWVALSGYQAFYLPVFVGLSRVAAHRLRLSAIVAAPVVWAGLELARGHLLTGFTLASLGHTQYRWIHLIQISDLAGAYGVGFVVMFGAASLARMIPLEGSPRAWWPVVPLAAVLAAVLGYGYARTAGPTPEPTARIALIQESIDIEFKSDPKMYDEIHRRYRDLSEKAVERYGGSRPVDLIVWPETMFRYSLIEYEPKPVDGIAQGPLVPDWWPGSQEEFVDWLAARHAKHCAERADLARRLGTALLLGVDSESHGPEGEKHFNSAVMVGPEGELLGRYDKVHLVMFGEYVPFAQHLRWLQRLTPLPFSNTPGTGPVAFEVRSPEGTLRIAPNICFETVLPHVIRRQITELAEAGREPHALVNLTNDGWFWGSSELDMHLICAVFRAVEFRKPLLIAANTGFSAWIDADGRILQRGPRRAPGTILAEVGPDPRRSWYLRYGDWPAGGCLAACAAFGLVGLRKRCKSP